jgi:hypothetical protein
MRLTVVAMAVAVIFVACSNAASAPTPSPVVIPIPPDAAGAVDAARQAAVSHLGIGPDQLQVSQVEAHQWPDSSLGCPQPGLLYSQIVTPGFLVVLSSGTHQLEYHTDMRSRVVLCHET